MDVGDFARQAVDGTFRASAFKRWVENKGTPAAVKAAYEQGKDAGLSMEWIAITASLGVPSDPRKWEHVKAHRRPRGWSITITYKGRPYAVGE